MKRLITSEVELSEDAKQILIDAGFKAIGGGKKFINYEFDVMNVVELGIKLYDLDLHLDDATRWENREPVTYNIINQGYRCPKCNGLDAAPNLSCVKDIMNGVR